MAGAPVSSNDDQRVIAGSPHEGTKMGRGCGTRGIYVLVSLVLALGTSALCLKYVPRPFIWLGLGWFFVFLCGFVFFKTGWLRILMLNASILVIMFANTEAYLSLRETPGPNYPNGYVTDDDVLGNAPAKLTRWRVNEFQHDKLIYDVTYTIDGSGLRIAPPADLTRVKGAILFFGCSFTYGEGVQDDETMPYQVGVQSDGNYQIYNFAFSAYAPNQMLASIESGRVSNIAKILPRFAIYQVIPDHALRVAGKIPYGRHNPRYQLDANGEVRLNGHFDDGQEKPSYIGSRLKGQLGKSAIYRAIKNRRRRVDESDIRLLLALVRRSRDLLTAQYPGIQFHVILWHDFRYDKQTAEELQAGFAKMNVPVHLVENILPDYAADPRRYILSPYDAHPSALADRLLAQYIVNKIVVSSPEARAPFLGKTDPFKSNATVNPKQPK